MNRDPLQAIHAANQGVRRIVLDNGLVVLLKRDTSAPMAAIQFWVRAGAIHEAENLGGGLSHYLEHMVFKGTPTRDPAAVSKDIADAGGDINAYTSNDRTVFHVTLPAKNWRTGLDVLADAVFSPSFPEDEWAREREVILRECDMNDDNPDRMLSRTLWETAYQVHPYRVPVIGWRDILKTMTRDHLVAYHRAHYSPHNAILAIAGDIPLDEMEAAVRERMATVPRTAVAPTFIPAEPPQMAPRRVTKSGPYQTTRVALAFHSTDLADADTPALDVLACAVGSGRSSLLNRRLLEDRRLVYAVEAFNYTPQYPGLFSVSAECDPAKGAEVEAAFAEEVERWKSEPFDPAVIERATRELLVAAVGELATMEGQASSMASGEFYEHNFAQVERYIAQLAAVTPEDLTRVARKYLDLDKATWVLLVPEKTAADEADASAAEASEAKIDLTLKTLANGVRVVLRPMPRLPVVSVAAVIGGGQLAEPEGQAGIAKLASAMLTRGTSKTGAMELAARLEQKGASLAVFSGRNTYGMTGGCLSDDLPMMLDSMAECLLDAQFPADELEKLRDIQLASLRRAQEKPMFHAQDLVNKALFKGHPLQYSSMGTEESIPTLDSEKAAAFHHRLLSRTNLVLSIFGDFDVDATVAQLETLFADVPDLPAPVQPPLPPPPAEPVTLTKRMPFLQTVIYQAWPGLSIPDSREVAADVLSDALTGLSSDLFIEVRDKRGLAYYVGATQFHTPVGGVFAIYSGTTENGAPAVLEQIAQQTARLSSAGPRTDEFERAKVQLLADDARALQSYGSLAQECATDELLGLGCRHFLDRAPELGTMTTEDVARAASSIFEAHPSVTAIVLPEEGAAAEKSTDGSDDDDGEEGDEAED